MRGIIYFELLEVFLLRLDHAEHETVSLSHALGVRRLDVLLNDLLPPAPAQPAAEEALHLLNLSKLDGVLDRFAQVRQGSCVADGAAFGVRLRRRHGSGCGAEATAAYRGRREGRTRCFLSQYANLKKQFRRFHFLNAPQIIE